MQSLHLKSLHRAISGPQLDRGLPRYHNEGFPVQARLQCIVLATVFVRCWTEHASAVKNKKVGEIREDSPRSVVDENNVDFGQIIMTELMILLVFVSIGWVRIKINLD